MAEDSTVVGINQLTLEEYLLIGLFCYINLVKHMDRIGIPTLMSQITMFFKVNEIYGGLLQTALLLTLAISAPIYGYCADRFSRKCLIIGSMIVWFAFSFGSPFTGYYWMLLLCRTLVGVGQSGFMTIAPCVIADIAVGGARTVLLTCFYLAFPIGNLGGILVTGSVYEMTDSWRYGLLFVPLLCLIGVILVYFMEFPSRGQKEGIDENDEDIEARSYKEDLRYLISVRSYVFITIAFTCLSVCMSSMAWWSQKFFKTGFSIISVAPISATVTHVISLLIMAVGCVLGLLLGLILSRMLRPRFPKIDPIICGVSLLIASALLTALLVTAARSQSATLNCKFLSMVFFTVIWALTTDLLLSCVDPLCRGSAHGIFLLFSQLFGDCISPNIVGLLAEYYKNNYRFTNNSFFLPCHKEKTTNPCAYSQDFHSLQWGLFPLVVMVIMAAVFYFIASLFIVEDIEEVSN